MNRIKKYFFDTEEQFKDAEPYLIAIGIAFIAGTVITVIIG